MYVEEHSKAQPEASLLCEACKRLRRRWKCCNQVTITADGGAQALWTAADTVDGKNPACQHPPLPCKMSQIPFFEDHKTWKRGTLGGASV